MMWTQKNENLERYALQTLRAKTCGLSPKKLSPEILDVIKQLTRAGFEAYIVGGSVRDLMLGKQPKDFDAVTNATPAQIKQVFGRRCKIIGRRFELAHVYYERDLIEVATFRAPPKKAVTSASGMVLRDNNWGNIEQDFARRDFSINTMYYQPEQGIVLDFCHACKDIKQRRLRLLGNAKKRFEEDPVRVLRALRFAAKLDFSFDPALEQALDSSIIKRLGEVSAHRLYDETQKLFAMGQLASVLPLLIKYQVWQQLFQEVPAQVTPFIQKAAENTDYRVRAALGVNPAFFYAVLLWQSYLKRSQSYVDKGLVAYEARVQAGIETLKKQSKRTIMPHFAEVFIRDTWEVQERLIQPKPQRVLSLLAHPRFRAGFDFLTLREQLGEDTLGMAAWWDSFQRANNDQKEQLLKRYQRDYQRRAKPSQDEDDLPLLTSIEAKVNQRAATRRKAQERLGNTQEDGQPAHIQHILKRRKRVQRDLANVTFGP